MAKLIKAGEYGAVAFPRQEGETKLAWWQRGVGGYIEPVYLADGGAILVNEDGIGEGLPINVQASMIARQRAEVPYSYTLFGDAVLLTAAEWADDSVDGAEV